MSKQTGVLCWQIKIYLRSKYRALSISNIFDQVLVCNDLASCYHFNHSTWKYTSNKNMKKSLDCCVPSLTICRIILSNAHKVWKVLHTFIKLHWSIESSLDVMIPIPNIFPYILRSNCWISSKFRLFTAHLTLFDFKFPYVFYLFRLKFYKEVVWKTPAYRFIQLSSSKYGRICIYFK